MGEMNVSILVTNFKKAHLFKESIKSIIPQLIEGDEFCVVDDNEYDGIRDVLGRYSVKWNYLITGNKEYRSGCKAKNIALKLSSNPICIISDPEVYHITPCITEIRKMLQENPKQFIVPGTMYLAKDINQTVEKFNEDRKKIGLIEHSMAPFIGGVMREELLNIGGWDERFKFWGNDDNDLMHRLGKNGCNTVCVDEFVAFHQWHARAPREAIGDANESLLYEKDKPIVANQDIEWGKI